MFDSHIKNTLNKGKYNLGNFSLLRADHFIDIRLAYNVILYDWSVKKRIYLFELNENAHTMNTRWTNRWKKRAVNNSLKWIV